MALWADIPIELDDGIPIPEGEHYRVWIEDSMAQPQEQDQSANHSVCRDDGSTCTNNDEWIYCTSMAEACANHPHARFGLEWGEPLRQCAACRVEAEVGATCPDDRVWYCKTCWEIWEFEGRLDKENVDNKN